MKELVTQHVEIVGRRDTSRRTVGLKEVDAMDMVHTKEERRKMVHKKELGRKRHMGVKARINTKMIMRILWDQVITFTLHSVQYHNRLNLKPPMMLFFLTQLPVTIIFEIENGFLTMS